MKNIISCIIFLNGLTIAYAQITPKANGTNSGIYAAPSGVSTTLQNNGKNDYVVAIPKVSGKTYGTIAFNFATAFSNGAPYKVTIKRWPAGQTCVMYTGSEGPVPPHSDTLKIGSDFTYDLISRSSDDGKFSSFYESNDPAVGGNRGEEGRYVTFVSSAAGFCGSTGKHRQIFWRDRNAGITKMISVSPDGEEGNADSYTPAISGDGRSVAFESYSGNLVPDDKNAVRDIFIWNSGTNKIERVSVGSGGTEANAESYEPSVSGDGNLVAFTSAAGNISATEKGVSNNNVFLRDRKSNTTIMISVDPAAQKGGGGSRPSISYDGNRIAFYSHTATLVADDHNGIWDIFLWDRDNPLLKRISLTADHKERNQGNESANRIVAPAISGNGRYIAYATTADNIVPGDNNNFQDVFVYDIKTDSTVIASKSSANKSGNGDSPIEQGEKIAVSFDGSWVAFSTNAGNLGVPAANVVMHNMLSGENRAVSTVQGSSVGRPTLSRSGSYVVFGIGGKIDSRFPSSGIFASYTGLGPCRFCAP